MIVAVTGATGYVGRFVVAELHRQGVTVRALARLESDRSGFAAPIAWVEGSLRDTHAVRVLVQGADALVHLAYAHVPGRYRGGEGSDLAGWLEANVHGSLNLLLAAQQAGVSTCVFLSSRAVFSRTEPGRVLDESHPTSPDTHYGAYKAAVEAFLKSFAAVGHMKTISVRATGVYGLTWPLSRSKWWDFVQAVLNDQPMATHGGGTEVHGQDVAAVIWKLLTSPGLDIDTVHLSDLYVTHHDVVRLARQFAGKPGALPPLPSSPPSHILVSRHLDTLGIALGGVPLLEKTIAQLVQAAQSNADSA